MNCKRAAASDLVLLSGYTVHLWARHIAAAGLSRYLRSREAQPRSATSKIHAIEQNLGEVQLANSRKLKSIAYSWRCTCVSTGLESCDSTVCTAIVGSLPSCKATIAWTLCFPKILLAGDPTKHAETVFKLCFGETCNGVEVRANMCSAWAMPSKLIVIRAMPSWTSPCQSFQCSTRVVAGRCPAGSCIFCTFWFPCVHCKAKFTILAAVAAATF